MSQTTASFIRLFERDINAVKNEISQYEDESTMWIIQGEIKNSGGNLAIHLAGNLRHFIGHVLGKSDYERKRDEEFSKKNVSRQEILNELDLAIQDVTETLKKLNAEDLKATYPIDVLKYEMTTEYFILHLLGHLNYHLGQLNYHRRLVLK